MKSKRPRKQALLDTLLNAANTTTTLSWRTRLGTAARGTVPHAGNHAATVQARVSGRARGVATTGRSRLSTRTRPFANVLYSSWGTTRGCERRHIRVPRPNMTDIILRVDRSHESDRRIHLQIRGAGVQSTRQYFEPPATAGQVDRLVRQQSALTLIKCFDRGEGRLNVIVKRLLALAVLQKRSHAGS